MTDSRSNYITKYLLSTLFAIFLSSFYSIHTISAATIDIMLVYDTTATSWVNSPEGGGMATFSLDAVNRMNLAAQNSNVDITFRLVHSVSVNYTHQDNFNNDLTAVTYSSGGFSNIDTLRDNYGADLVALLVDTGSPWGTTGLGWILTRYSGSPSYAYTVSAIQAVKNGHTLTHEVGHNMGAGHSKSQASYPGPNNSLAPYSAGWYFTGTNNKDYHTIMAYGNDGTQSYWSAPIFSTPLLTYQGTTSGHPQDGDNSRILRDTMNAVAGYRDAEGSLSVNIEPASARTDGGQWRRTGTSTWRNSGFTENNLLSGQYVIEFKPLDGWEEPADITVDVYANQTATETVDYSAVYVPVGSLSVTIEPQDAISIGAQWRRAGTAVWLDSEFVEGFIPVGQYEIEFKEVDGWDTPQNAIVDIYNTQTTSVSATYSLIYVPVGSLNVTILPPEAVAAGAQWRRVGATTWYDSGSTEGNIDTGDYTVEFESIDGWISPAEVAVEIVDGQNISTSGTYIDESPAQTKAMPWMLLLLAE